MPYANPNFCHLCGMPVERMGIKYGCYHCAVIINSNGGIVFPENDQPQYAPAVRLQAGEVIPLNIFKVFKV